MPLCTWSEVKTAALRQKDGDRILWRVLVDYLLDETEIEHFGTIFLLVQLLVQPLQQHCHCTLKGAFSGCAITSCICCINN